MKGLYIHIPFCNKKCKYCDFVSFPCKEDYFDEYIDTLIKEMMQYKSEKIDTVFIGGGTPTVLSPNGLKRLIQSCFRIFDIEKNYEFTIELNPGTVDEKKINTIIESGINRISVGVQSFNDDELKIIGRIHNADLAYNTICKVQETGFSNINVDIMMSLPSQNINSLMKTLETAVHLNIPHISCYSLIIEEGTVLEKEYAKGMLVLPDEDEEREMYHQMIDFLKDHGFYQYEISNFAKPGFECRHNIKYWQCNEYIGIGVSAHSYIGNIRYANTADLDKYISGEFRDESNIVSQSDLIFEFIMMGFRMNRGISEKEFLKRFDIDIRDIYEKQFEKFISNKLIIYENGFYRLSTKGIDLSNSVLCEFILK